jgi:hypothetical protein
LSNTEIHLPHINADCHCLAYSRADLFVVCAPLDKFKAGIVAEKAQQKNCPLAAL